MTEWQKVRVQFTDADGDEVSAVMWSLDGSLSNHKDGTPSDYPHYLYMEHGVMVRVTPIRELPTGVGAVIRIKDVGVLVRNSIGIWCAANVSGDLDHPRVAEMEYEVLSEGIKL